MMLQRRLLALTSGIRWYIGGLVFLGLAITGTYIGQGLLAAQIVTCLFTGASWESILWLLGGLLVCIVSRTLLLWGREVGAMVTVAQVKQTLRSRLYQHLLVLGPGFMEKTRTGTVQSTLVDGVEALEGYMGYYIPQAFVALLAPMALLGYLFTLDPLVALLILICIILVSTTPLWWDRLLGKYGRSHWQAYSTLNAQFVDSMQGMTTLKAFNASRKRGALLQKEAEALYRATMKQLSISMIRTGIVGLAMSGGYCPRRHCRLTPSSSGERTLSSGHFSAYPLPHNQYLSSSRTFEPDLNAFKQQTNRQRERILISIQHLQVKE